MMLLFNLPKYIFFDSGYQQVFGRLINIAVVAFLPNRNTLAGLDFLLAS